MSASRKQAFCSGCQAVHGRPVGRRCPRVLSSVARRRSGRHHTAIETAASLSFQNQMALVTPPQPAIQPPLPPTPPPTFAPRTRRISAPGRIADPGPHLGSELLLGPLPMPRNPPAPGPIPVPIPGMGASPAQEAVLGPTPVSNTEKLLHEILAKVNYNADELTSVKNRMTIFEEEYRADREGWFDPHPQANNPDPYQSHATTSDPYLLQHQHEASNTLADTVASRLSEIRLNQRDQRHHPDFARTRHTTEPYASRHPAPLQSQYDLTGTTRMSAGRANVSTGEPATFEWPQEHVFRYGQTDPVEFKTLTMAEFSTGFTTSTLHAHPHYQRPMNLFYERLMQDAVIHEWALIRNFAHIVLTRVFKGTLQWGDKEQLDHIRSVHLYGAAAAGLHTRGQTRASYTTGQGAGQPTSQATSARGQSRPMLCHRYNDGACQHNATHTTNGRTYQHGCTYCLGRLGRFLPHAETECQTKLKTASKNSTQGPQHPRP